MSDLKLLQEGDVVEIKKGMAVYSDIPKTFFYANELGNFDIVKDAHLIVGEKDNWLDGKYVVVSTSLEGGSSGRDPYPNGHRVFCTSINDNKDKVKNIKLNFYQTGCFTATITKEQIQPIGKATPTWKFEEEAVC